MITAYEDNKDYNLT